jgi:sugar transferase (PEP-CTERM/EpsH1 system associated)
MHVVHSLGTGGTEAGVRKLLAGLDGSAFQQTVCTVLDSPAADPTTGTRVISLGRSRRSIGFLVPDLARVFERERPHIVHSRNWGTIEAVPAARLARVPGVIHSEHGFNMHTVNQQPWRRTVFRRVCFKWADLFLVVSQGLRDHYARQLRIPVDRIQVVANGVDTQRFRPLPECRKDFRRKLGFGENTFVVGTVSRLDPVKNHRGLFRAAERMLSEGCPLQLVIVGDGPERASLENDVRHSPLLRKRMLFVGEASNISEWLNSFDVFVLPSLAEGMSNTLLEAMAAGVAPVASRVGGNPEVIEEGLSGLLFEAADTNELAAYLKGLALDRKWRHDLGARARHRAENCFSLKAMLTNYAQVYDGVLANKGITHPEVPRGTGDQQRRGPHEVKEPARNIV